MTALTPKEQHELLLANADRTKIVLYLSEGQEQDVSRIAVILAKQCDLLVHFQRLWSLRVSGLDQRLNTDSFTRNIYMNKRELYKELFKSVSK